jgi:hypothetical protein
MVAILVIWASKEAQEGKMVEARKKKKERKIIAREINQAFHRKEISTKRAKRSSASPLLPAMH